MSLFLDQKYLSLVSNRLPLFKRKNDALYNCRCIICGDSSKNRHKARGYFFKYKNELRYKCHNCDASMTFGSFLKNLDSLLFSQYSLEKYSENNNVKLTNNTLPMVFEQPVFKSSEQKLLDKILKCLVTLPEDNEAVRFCKQRKIPDKQLGRLYYIESIKDIVQFNSSYKESIKGNEPRLVIPFYDTGGNLTGLTCRALRGEALRYITVKVKEDSPLIFGYDFIDRNKPVYVVEGPLDSLFLTNSIAVAGTSFSKISSIGVDKSNLVLIFDNQPRNKEVCKVIEKNIDQGYKVVIWPQSIVEKDINEMILSEINVEAIINKNTFSGLTAKAKFIAWKRC